LQKKILYSRYNIAVSRGNA